MPDLVEHCVNLYRVDVESMDSEITDILIVLGSRIRVLTIEERLFYSYHLSDELYKACTNLEAVHLGFHGLYVIDTFSSIRTKLVSLTA